MSTTTIGMGRSPFSTAAFAQLVRRLQHTNARYNHIAHQLRSRIRPTHHAKLRAYGAGLRIDTTKARASPDNHVLIIPTPVVDTSATTPSWLDPQANAYPTTEPAGRGPTQGDAYMRGAAPRTLPKLVRKSRRRKGRQRVMLRLPPLKLSLDVNHPSGAPRFQGPVPGAPRLLPKQLPEDESGVEEMMLGSASHFVDGPDALFRPTDVQVYSGLCITIPPRPLKRKLQDTEGDDDDTAEQPKRILKVRWNESQLEKQQTL